MMASKSDPRSQPITPPPYSVACSSSLLTAVLGLRLLRRASLEIELCIWLTRDSLRSSVTPISYIVISS